jgi:acyl-CoA thioester hydrolase
VLPVSKEAATDLAGSPAAEASAPGDYRRGAAYAAGGPARITVRQAVQWADTDASGHHHFSAPLLWVERAETALYESLRIGDITAGCVPRVHFELDYVGQLFFRDVFEVTLSVEQVGHASLTYRFQIDGEDSLTVRGRFVVVLTDHEGKKARPWPDEARTALTNGGEQAKVSLAARRATAGEGLSLNSCNHQAVRTAGRQPED